MNFDDVYLLSVERLSADPHWRMSAHFHPFHEIIVVLSGRLHVKIQRHEILAKPGDVLFYPQGNAHEEWSDPADPVETLFLSLEWEAYPHDLPVLLRDTHGRLRQLISWLYADRDAYAPQSEPMRRGILQVMLAEMLNAASQKEHSLVATIRNYLRDHIDEPLNLETLAQHAKMSKYHFLRKYKALTGRTPIEDLRIIRIEYARNLILTTNLPLKVIAPKAGLGDEYHLSRMFRNYLNTTPGELRKEVKIKDEAVVG